ncbi:MAG: NAD-dependent epimerase/dehydratase family protein [Acidimicrobiia bacterium]
MRVFVTGGSGVVGGAVVRHLIQRGDRVRALARSRPAIATVAGLGADPIAGSVRDRAALAEGMAGVDVVFHVAGVNEMCVSDPGPMEAVNVDGTRRLLAVAEEVGVPRVVVTSSAAAIGEPHGTVGTETSPHRGWFLSHYERSKYLQEQAAFAHEGDVEVVCVNPSSVQGPGRATGTGRIIVDVLAGRIPLLPDAPVSMVDIDDCAEGHLLAAERGLPGRRYLLSAFTLTTRELLDLLGERVGIEPRVAYLPASVTRGLARGVGAAERLVGATLPAPVCGEMLRTLAFGHAYDGSLARSALGLTHRSPESTLERLVAWFRAEGLLRV